MPAAVGLDHCVLGSLLNRITVPYFCTSVVPANVSFRKSMVGEHLAVEESSKETAARLIGFA